MLQYFLKQISAKASAIKFCWAFFYDQIGVLITWSQASCLQIFYGDYFTKAWVFREASDQNWKQVKNDPLNDAFALSDYKFRVGFQKNFLLKHYLLLQAGFYLLATILQKSLQHFAISQKFIITALKSSERCFHTFKNKKNQNHRPATQTLLWQNVERTSLWTVVLLDLRWKRHLCCLRQHGTRLAHLKEKW